MACLVVQTARPELCPKQAPVIRALQFAELVSVMLLVWWMGRAIGGAAVGWVALCVAFGAAPLLLRSVNELMTEMTTLFFTTAAMAAGVAAVGVPSRVRRRLAWTVASGALLGLAALTRPAFLYLIPAAALGIALLGRRRGPWPAAAFLAAAAAALAPWIIRNAVVMGRPALTFGYDSHTLVQRIAFDTMSPREWALSFLCWLPDGNEMGRGLFGAGACDRFGWDEHPNSFYVLGLRHMLPQTLAAAGGYPHHLHYLLTHYIAQEPLTHVLVSVPLALRGAYVSHWWGVVLLVAALVWTWRALRGWASGPAGAGKFLVVSLPAWFMLAFNAAVAVNQPRYNLMLVPAYAVAGALSLTPLLAAARRRLAARMPGREAVQ